MPYISSVAFSMALMMLESDDDREYVTRLYYSYRGLFYKIAMKFFGPNMAEVEDAISSAIAAICEYLSAIRRLSDDKIPAYMVAIIRHVCIKRISKLNKERKNVLKIDISELDESLAAPENLEDIVFAKVSAAFLLDAYYLDLNERDKELIRMRHIDMLSINQIACAWGISEGAARTALSRAKKRLVDKARKRADGLK